MFQGNEVGEQIEKHSDNIHELSPATDLERGLEKGSG